MSLVINTAEGQANTTALTVGNSGGTSGSAFSLVAKHVTGEIAFSTDHAAHGTESYKLAQDGSGVGCAFGWTGYSATSIAVRAYLYMPSLPDVSTNNALVLVDNTSSAQMAALQVTTTGQLKVVNFAGSTLLTSTSTLSTGTWYRLELVVVTGTTTSNGTIKAAVYVGDSASVFGDCTYSSTTANTGTVNVGSARFGTPNSNTTSSVYYFDDLAANDGATNFIGAPSTPPVASFTETAVALAASFTDTSTATSPATITGPWAWTFGDGGTSTSQNPTHTYSTSGTYTVGLTVTDSTGTTGSTSQSVTVLGASGTASVVSITNGANWTPSAGSGTAGELACVTDGDPTTFVTSQSPPTAQPFVCVLGALTPPASGQPLKVIVGADSLLATSASFTAKIYEGGTGGTLRSTLTGQAIPAGSGSSVAGVVTLTFPWSDVQSVTTGGWNALTLELDTTAA